MRRTRENLTFWRRHLEQWGKSGLTQEAYCRQQDLSFTSLTYYRNRINREGKAQPANAVSLVPVMVKATPAATTTMTDRCRPAPLEIRLRNGRVVVLAGAFDDAELGRVIRLLETLPC